MSNLIMKTMLHGCHFSETGGYFWNYLDVITSTKTFSIYNSTLELGIGIQNTILCAT